MTTKAAQNGTAPLTRTMGENVEVSVTGDILTITIDLSHRGGLSASRKTVRVASNGTDTGIPGTDVKMGLNLYVRATDADRAAADAASK